jgi:sporulation protein YlmC with PRC-barrel domain
LALRGADVYSQEGKRIGRVRDASSDYFIAFKRGLVMDEEFKIPVSAVSAVERGDSGRIVRVNLSEQQLRHGFEFSKGGPNSSFVSGAASAESKVPERQVIHYESIEPAKEAATSAPHAVSEYLCDMCDKKFSKPSSLQRHRARQHKAATGV